MCLQKYKFNILDNGFLVRKQKLKMYNKLRKQQYRINDEKIKLKINTELSYLYGNTNECNA